MTLLLVDDEYYFRKTLIQTIRNSPLSISNIFEATDGEEALNIIKNNAIDIILLDINMPRMNGLQFAQTVKQLEYNVRIILVTGYDDFEYARSALKLGVVDYLLKPIQDAELLKVLKIQLDYLIKLNDELSSEKQKDEQNLLITKEYYIKRLLLEKSVTEVEEIQSTLSQAGCSLCKWGSYYVCVGDVDYRKGLSIEETEQSTRLLKSSIEHSFAVNLELCLDNESRIVLIIDATTFADTDRIRTQLLSFTKSTALSTHSFGISSLCTSFEFINAAYSEAVKALSSKVVSERASIIFYSRLQIRKYDEYHVTKNTREQLLLGVTQRDYTYVETLLNEILFSLTKLRIRLDHLSIIGIHLLEPCMHCIIDKNLIGDKLYVDLYNSMYDELRNIIDLVELFSYIKSIYFICCKENKNANVAVNTAVKDVLEYINTNYSSPLLSIEEIAETVAKNYNYLCVLFKKSMGITINEYIMDVRMKHALNLLSTGGHNISTIAENTGFSNISYFTKCFKKKFGYPPSRFLLR